MAFPQAFPQMPRITKAQKAALMQGSLLDRTCAHIQQRPFRYLIFHTHSGRHLAIDYNGVNYTVEYTSPSGIELKFTQPSCTSAQLRTLVNQYITNQADLHGVDLFFGSYGYSIW